MSLEFEIWPTGAAERLARAQASLLLHGLTVTATQSVLRDLIEIYEDVAGENRDLLVASVLSVPQSEFVARVNGPGERTRLAADSPHEYGIDVSNFLEFAAVLAEFEPVHLSASTRDLFAVHQRVAAQVRDAGASPPRGERLWLDAMHLAWLLKAGNPAKSRRLYEWILATFPDRQSRFVRVSLREVGGGVEEPPSVADAAIAHALRGVTTHALRRDSIAENLPRLKLGLACLGYDPSPRNSAVFLHPVRSDRRIVFKPLVVRFECADRRSGRLLWNRRRSYDIASEVGRALEGAAAFCRPQSTSQDLWIGVSRDLSSTPDLLS